MKRVPSKFASLHFTSTYIKWHSAELYTIGVKFRTNNKSANFLRIVPSPPPFHPPPVLPQALLDREMDGEEVDAYSSWSMMQSQPSMMDDLMDIRHGQPLSCQVYNTLCTRHHFHQTDMICKSVSLQAKFPWIIRFQLKFANFSTLCVAPFF